ncbi:hypothetical protein TI39_contig386g00004 [Zymoseptoria brevis]|uniref:Transglutaminase-like domain-containing protein n=1 Tax=Zymoseptoria brevis TaxID=1047168 RepID=A0A0F4GN68_9PEZI|nr:hypothetical protein TI39_contig386g00004 [Zymoseptoria brevis]
MNSATSTLEVRLMRVFDRVVDRPKPSLPWPDPEASIGIFYRTLGRHQCWEMRGHAREAYLRLAGGIKSHLERHGDIISATVIWAAYMVGKTKQCASPTVFFCSKNPRARKAVRNEIDGSGLLASYPGFRTGDCTRPPHLDQMRQLAMGDSDAADEHSADGDTTCYNPMGRRIHVIRSTDDELAAPATIGAILKSDEWLYFTTAAHAFGEFGDDVFECGSPTDSAFEWDIEDDQDESLVPGVRSSAAYLSPGTKSTKADGEFRIIRDVDFFHKEDVKFSSANRRESFLDYCLIKVDQHDPRLFHGTPSANFCYHDILPRGVASEGPLDGKVIAYTGSKGAINGNLSGTPVFITLTGGRVTQELWTVHFDDILENGDCGSMVIGASSGNLEGHIIAGDTDNGSALIVPAYQMLKDVQLRFDSSIRLLTVEHCFGLAQRVTNDDASSVQGPVVDATVDDVAAEESGSRQTSDDWAADLTKRLRRMLSEKRMAKLKTWNITKSQRVGYRHLSHYDMNSGRARRSSAGFSHSPASGLSPVRDSSLSGYPFSPENMRPADIQAALSRYDREAPMATIDLYRTKANPYAFSRPPSPVRGVGRDHSRSRGRSDPTFDENDVSLIEQLYQMERNMVHAPPTKAEDPVGATQSQDARAFPSQSKMEAAAQPYTARDSSGSNTSQQVAPSRSSPVRHSLVDASGDISSTATAPPQTLHLTNIPREPLSPTTYKDLRFRRLLISLSNSPCNWEDPALLDAALANIPLGHIYREAQAKADALQAVASLLGNDAKPAWGHQDCVIRALMTWFKRDFFQWVNNPRCPVCESPTTARGMVPPTVGESTRGATRVELYQCSNTMCQAHERFPRYNDAFVLLETRRGRVGEWTTCFTMLCRALGSRVRLVWSAEDHVWTEVYSVHQQRWVHVDVAEGAWDKPMLYTQEWGKMLSYCIAFSVDGCCDVTRRYVCDPDIRMYGNPRTKCAEEVLWHITREITAMRRSDRNVQELLSLRAEDQREELALQRLAIEALVTRMLDEYDGRPRHSIKGHTTKHSQASQRIGGEKAAAVIDESQRRARFGNQF